MSVFNTHRPEGVPSNAARYLYIGENGKQGIYYVWLRSDGKWEWEAMGNSGLAPTETDASERCRWWIKYAQ